MIQLRARLHKVRESMRGRVKHKQVEEDTQILRTAAAESSAQAVRQVREHRLPLTVVEKGNIVEVAPDGTRTLLKELPSARLGLAKGMILAYR